MAEEGLGSRFPAASQSPGLMLWRVTNRWQAAMRAALAPHELTHVQYVLLASLTWLADREPERLVTQVDLAGFASTDPMMTSQVLRSLERAGLVERLPHPTDGRTTLVQITGLGRSTVEDATVTLNNDVFADIGISDGESRTLAESIQTLRRSAGDF